MELIAINIKAVKNQISTKNSEMFHAELDWYYGHEEKYLNELPILDHEMKQVKSEGKSLFFGDIMSNFDVILGSDLIYFGESIEPLCQMLKFLFSKNKNLVFYLCHMKRDIPLHE